MRGLLTTSLLAALVIFAGAGMNPAVAAQTRTVRPQAAPTRARIIEIQNALAREGFYSAKPSGRWDAATTAAMKKFQTASGLTATGKVGALSLQKLGLGSEVAGRGAPLPPANPRASVLGESELLASDAEIP